MEQPSVSRTPETARTFRDKSRDTLTPFERLVADFMVRECRRSAGYAAATARRIAQRGELHRLLHLAAAPTIGKRYTYVLRYPELGTDRSPYKIGSTNALEQRLASFQTASPYPLTWTACVPHEVVPEMVAHQVLAAARMCGEWFAPTPLVEQFVSDAIAFQRAYLSGEGGRSQQASRIAARAERVERERRSILEDVDALAVAQADAVLLATQGAGHE